MSLVFVKRSVLPAVVHGRNGAASVVITGSGRIGMSVLATKALGEGLTHVAVAFDPESRIMAIYGPSPKIKKALPNEGDWVKLNINKKSNAVDFAATNLLNHAPTFNGKLYEYRASGNQTFEVKVNEKEQCISFTVPEGKLIPKPVVKREKKDKKKKETVSSGTAATPEASEGELVLESA
jgi:hypothetical protein